jgi:hypothetical protein
MTELGDRLNRLADAGAPRAEASDVFERAHGSAARLRRRRAHQRLSAAGAALVVAAVVIALVVARPDSAGVRVEATGTSTTSVPTTATQYAVDATVVQVGSVRPHLCLTFMAVAAPAFAPVHPSATTAPPSPPLCDGPAVAGWDWSKIVDKLVSGNATWGDYHVVGTYRGSTLTITRRPRPASAVAVRPPEPTLPGPAPCPAPAGGWVVRDRSRVDLSDFLALQSVVQGEADYSTMWWDHTTPVDGAVHGSGDFPHEVATIAYTGDLAAHRAQIEAVWGGPICLIRHRHTESALRAVVSALQGAEATRLGVPVLDVEPNDVADRVDATTVIATPAMQAAVDRAFGAGTVHLEPPPPPPPPPPTPPPPEKPLPPDPAGVDCSVPTDDTANPFTAWLNAIALNGWLDRYHVVSGSAASPSNVRAHLSTTPNTIA